MLSILSFFLHREMRTIAVLFLFNLGTSLFALASLVLWGIDDLRNPSCNPSTPILFVLAALFFGLLCCMFPLFLCRPPYPFGIASALSMAMLLLQLPQLMMSASVAVQTDTNSFCYAWNVGMSLLSALPWIWVTMIVLYAKQRGLFVENEEGIGIYVRTHPSPEAVIMVESVTRTTPSQT